MGNFDEQSWGNSASAVTGVWNRLKVCPNDDCAWAFYDESRNRSRRWCSMNVCGNCHKGPRVLRQTRRVSDLMPAGLSAVDEPYHAPGEGDWGASRGTSTSPPATPRSAATWLEPLSNQSVAWYWACVVGEGRPLVTVVDHDVRPPRPPSLEVRAEGLCRPQHRDAVRPHFARLPGTRDERIERDAIGEGDHSWGTRDWWVRKRYEAASVNGNRWLGRA